MIYLKQLTIDAFRGISTSLTLDLSAPITLIYAPNGVGKTSICDAAEWLITSAVKRLDNVGAGPGDLRCMFSAQEQETRVTGSLIAYEKEILVERKLNNCRWAVDGQPLRAVTLSDLLETLAPSAAEAGVHRTHANNSRQIWLRGTRFLSGDSLAALLDSDEASMENRQRLFADLLGVGHLLETERQIDAYLTAISPYLREQQKLVDDRSTALRERQSQADLQQDATQQTLLPTAIEKLLEASRMLGSKDIGPAGADVSVSELRKIIVLVRGDLDRKKASWNNKRQAEIRLAPDWPTRHTLEAQQSADQQRTLALATLINENTARSDNVARQLAILKGGIEQGEQQIAHARDRSQRLIGAFAYAQPLLSQFLTLSKQRSLSMGEAFNLVDSAGSEMTRATTANRLKALRDELPIRQREAEELRILKAQYDTALSQIALPDVVERNAKELTDLTGRAAELRRDYERAAGPTEQLQRLAISVIELLNHEAECPVCRYNWNTAEALKQAMLAASGATPPSLADLAEKLKQAEIKVRKLQDEISRNNLNVNSADALNKRIRAVESAQTSFAARASELGLGVQDRTLDKMDIAIARLNLVDGLKRVNDEIKACEAIIDESPPRDRSIQEFIDAVKSALERRAQTSSSAIEVLRQQEAPIQAELIQLRRDKQGADVEQTAIKKRIENNALRLQALRLAWQVLARNEEWSDETFNRLASDLRKENETLSQAEQLIGHSEHLIEAYSRLDEIKRLQEELGPIEAEKNRLNRYVEAAATVQTGYREIRHQHVRKQMEDFVRVISALFIRMQANEVYDRITEGDEASPLSWRALSEGLAMDPDRKFSQGQKQDFALSIFLARARGLGGTFFMDEPLAHLDDLNRVALLDVFRAICLENQSKLSIVLTTASKPVLRHIVEKFARVGHIEAGSSKESPLLKVIDLEGNPRSGIRVVSPVQVDMS